MGKDASTPPAPDYVGAAQAQGQANVQAAQVGAALNRVNTQTPYGDLTYSQPNPNNPNQWNADVTLSPDQQKLLDEQSIGQESEAQDANGLLTSVHNATATPFDTSDLTARQGTLTTPDLSMYNGGTTAPNSSVDMSGVTPIQGANDWGANAQQAQDAAYAKQTAILDPQYAQQEDQLRSSLAASGVAPGSEAYSQALDQFARQKQTDYGSARDSAVLQGNAEQATLAGESLTTNNQLYSQALQSAGFNNSAQAQDFGEGITASQNNNAVDQTNFQNQDTAATFADQQRQQEMTEEEYLRELPLNEYNALASGAQVTQPNFNVGTSQTATPGASPIFAATQANQTALDDIFNQQQGADNANTSAGAGIVSTGILAAVMF